LFVHAGHWGRKYSRTSRGSASSEDEFIRSYSPRLFMRKVSLKQYLFPNKYLHMATHINTNTWKMD